MFVRLLDGPSVVLYLAWWFVAFFLTSCVRYVFFFFFFSSRRRHTRSLCDWSSDVCSSDLPGGADRGDRHHREERRARPPRAHREIEIVVVEIERDGTGAGDRVDLGHRHGGRGSLFAEERAQAGPRSEERRVGKECRARQAA